jgi:3-hexulose-6-phosphate synthase
MTKLQLALDFTDLDEAISIAEEASPYVDWIEAGTPLIKAEGLYCIGELKRLFPDKTIVADMKTMDTGGLEATLAAEAGADITTVLGAADLSTIKGAIKEAHKRETDVIVDLLNVPKSKWAEIDSLDPDYICIHVGIDQQKSGMDPIKLINDLNVKSKKIIAGGINTISAEAAAKAGFDVIIVGSAITKAKDPQSAAKAIKEAILRAEQ